MRGGFFGRVVRVFRRFGRVGVGLFFFFGYREKNYLGFIRNILSVRFCSFFFLYISGGGFRFWICFLGVLDKRGLFFFC